MAVVKKILDAVMFDVAKDTDPAAANCHIELGIEEPGGKVTNVQFPSMTQLGNITLRQCGAAQGQYHAQSGDLDMTVPFDIKMSGVQHRANVKFSTNAIVSVAPHGLELAGSPVRNHTQATGTLALVAEINVPNHALCLFIGGNLIN